MLPLELVLQGSIWLMGVGVWWLSTRPTLLKVAFHPVYRVTTSLFLFGCLAATKSQSVFGSDYIVGVAFTLWVCSFLGPCRSPQWIRKTSVALSEFSYTLYVVHFPIMFLIATALLKGARFDFDCAGMLWFSGIFLASLGVSVLMWSQFERRTDAVRKWALQWSPRSKESAAPVPAGRNP